MLLLIPCFIFPFYEVVEDKDIFINNHEPFAIGGNSKITFFETAWDYKNSYDNFSLLKMTVKDTSYVEILNIYGFNSEECDDECGDLSPGVTVIYKNSELSNDYVVAAESITFFMDVVFEFSDGVEYYGSYQINLNELDSNNVEHVSEINCSKKLPSEIIVPLKNRDGNFVHAKSTSYSGYIEARIFNLEDSNSSILVCGLD